MALSVRLTSQTDRICSAASILLLVGVVSLHLSVVQGSVSGSLNRAPNGTGSKSESTSSIIANPPTAQNQLAVVDDSIDKMSKIPLTVEKQLDSLSSSSTPDHNKEETAHHQGRTKRNWKSNRVQAAWGKRDRGSGSNEDAASVVRKMPDARLRRKWNQVGRQAWGKRYFDLEVNGQMPEEHSPVRSRDNDGSSTENQDASTNYELADRNDLAALDELILPGRNTRKWGVGSAKAAWGKRKWGASNDMRVWGKRSAVDDIGDEDDGNFELQDAGSSSSESRVRSKRSAVDGPTRPRFSDKQWLQRAAVEAVAAKRLRLSASPFASSAGRAYVGPKRNWQTNTMKVWGKRSDDLEDEDVSSSTSAFADDDEEQKDGRDEYARYVWNNVDSDTEPTAWKRGWTGDNSLRVWG